VLRRLGDRPTMIRVLGFVVLALVVVAVARALSERDGYT
jgi:hypothetical protein